jgi:hypothetical protein
MLNDYHEECTALNNFHKYSNIKEVSMIVWFNVKITDDRKGQVFARIGLPEFTRFDIARYGFASFLALEPLVSKYVFTISVSDGFAERKSEMAEWIKSTFPADKTYLELNRCDTFDAWERMKPVFDATGDDTIYFTGNDDHVFVDSSIDRWKSALDAINLDKDPLAVFLMSHYPESLNLAVVYGAALTPDADFLMYPLETAIGMQVLKINHFYEYIDVNKPLAAAASPPKEAYFRLDCVHKCPGVSKIYVPTKEVARHFDGYWLHGKTSRECTPMIIPPGFFEGEMIIRYGFSDRDNSCVNINPLSDLFINDPINGTDFKFTLDDIPLFWKSRIKEIQIADNINHAEMITARNHFYMQEGKAQSQAIPDSIFANHMLKTY